MKKINLSDYFAESSRELDEFEAFVGVSGEEPPQDGFARLMAGREASEKFSAYQEGTARPTSFGMLIEIVATSVGKNRFRLAEELQVDRTVWSKVILDEGRPDALPGRIYAELAKRYCISLAALRSSLEGTFRLLKAGISGSATPVYARSDRKTTGNSDVTSAMHELLRKAGRTAGDLDQNAVAFLTEIELCMKT